ncbi:hypothetical protein U9M48_020429 [Paspalum notatum var. saurae]|uniref:PWWP domain-containing protein n=1 Tax=Paspalum notatum var. saurae TaxID=547442 RepID=A0AAQ3TEN4_PASNO
MEAQTLTPCADADADAAAAAAAPQTLAAGELVWAKPAKPRRHCWWPARLRAACPASDTRDAQVSYFGDGAPSAPPAQLRRFADPDADAMACGSTARAFYAAVAEAHARAVAALRAQLTCGCVPPPPPGEDSSAAGVANLTPTEFLAALREAALDVSLLGLVDRARLTSWVLAVAEGWGPDGAKHYPRRLPEDLVDKIDLDVPAGEDRDAEDWLAEYEPKALGRPEETPMQKKRSVTTLIEELDEERSGSHGTLSSGKRERKKSKYLSPPYTNLGVAVLTRKPSDLPKPLMPKVAEDGSKVLQLPGSVIAEDVLLLVQSLGKEPHHKGIFPEAAEEFLYLFRSSMFSNGALYKSYKAHDCPAVFVSSNVGMDIDSASKEATELEAGNIKNVQSTVADVSDRSVSEETTKFEVNIHIDRNLQSAADVPVSNGLSPMHEDVAQPIDDNKEPGGVEVCMVQQSYASLQAMVPEILEKENTNSTDVATVNHGLKDENQNDEAVQKVKLPAEAVAQHSYGEGVNGICPNPTNPTPKETKKAAQHFRNPAAIHVEFADGVIVPSREELLSTFGKYGSLIESRTEIVKATRSARVVFGKSIEAEAAYNNQQLLGQFGPPFATATFMFLEPIDLSMPSPLSSSSPSPSLGSKLPLPEIRKNLEAMISSRHSALNKETSSDGLNSVPDKLLGEMQGLLAKVNKMITRPSADTL